jgi:signal transduction histidine kinase
MSTIVVQAAVARESVPSDAKPAIAAIENVRSVGRSALGEIRQLLGVMRGSANGLSSLTASPKLTELEPLLAQAREGGVAVETRIEGEAATVPPALELAAYRVIQEALTNVVKHARGSNASVALVYGRDDLTIRVENGAGSAPAHRVQEPEASGGGLGIKGMRERVALLGGSLEAGPTAQGGFRVSAVIPWSAGP